MNEDHDMAVALQLEERFNSETCSKNLIHKRYSEKNIAKPSSSSLVDTTWEYVDPTPDVHCLFRLFNNRFFWGKLSGVEVKWSSRMTSCAGVCCYEGRGGLCSVRLSAPLLKLRPRKDLIETLLHEMIHAYLFVTHNNRDRDGHGPEFHKHMNRINKEAGTKITVRHSFHEEVKFYQQHWWRCDGPCQSRPPYFGTVRRAANRAPCPNDFWWNDHKTTCGGNFIKIKEPDGFKSKGTATSKEGTSGLLNSVQDIRSFFPAQGVDATFKDKNRNGFEKSLPKTGVENNVVGFKDLSRNQSDVIGKTKQNGWEKTGERGKKLGGFGGVVANKGSGTLVVTTKDKKPTKHLAQCSSANSFVPFKGEGHVLGTSNDVRQVNNAHSHGNKNVKENNSKVSSATKRNGMRTVEVEKILPPKKIKGKNIDASGSKSCVTSSESPVKGVNFSGGQEPFGNVIEIPDSPEKSDKVLCPVCSKVVDVAMINSHLDGCVDSTYSENSSVVHCPVCSEELEETELSQHLETCVNCVFVDDDEEETSGFVSGGNSSVDGRSTDKLYPCPCCMTWVKPELMNHHLDECLSSKLLRECQSDLL